jgi:hypothetical protein
MKQFIDYNEIDLDIWNEIVIQCMITFNIIVRSYEYYEFIEKYLNIEMYDCIKEYINESS